MKIAKYIILELLIIVLSLLWGTMMTNDHQSGEICITPAWGGLKFKTIWNLVGITIFIGLEKMNKPHVVMKHLQSSVFIF